MTFAEALAAQNEWRKVVDRDGNAGRVIGLDPRGTGYARVAFDKGWGLQTVPLADISIEEEASGANR